MIRFRREIAARLTKARADRTAIGSLSADD